MTDDSSRRTLSLMFVEARRSAAAWTKREKELRAALVESGLADEVDGHEVVDDRGVPVLRVKKVPSSRLDATLVKAKHPDVYAECEVRGTTTRFEEPK